MLQPGRCRRNLLKLTGSARIIYRRANAQAEAEALASLAGSAFKVGIALVRHSRRPQAAKSHKQIRRVQSEIRRNLTVRGPDSYAAHELQAVLGTASLS